MRHYLISKLIEIQNEMRAQKSGMKINYGMLTKPDSTPSASWSGRVGNLVNTTHGVNARWIVTFTRTDNIPTTPIVNFMYKYDLEHTFYDDIAAAGYTSSITGRDKGAIDEYVFYDSISEVGLNYVKWRIDISGQWYYSSSDGTTVTLDVEALSLVPGVLSLERIL